MKAALTFCACALATSLMAGDVSAHPREGPAATPQSRSVMKRAIAWSDREPRARIRGDTANQGLGPKAFARWISRHPAIVPAATRSGMRVLAAAGSPRADAFAIADVDDNGRVSADELADFIARQPALAGADSPI